MTTFLTAKGKEISEGEFLKGYIDRTAKLATELRSELDHGDLMPGTVEYNELEVKTLKAEAEWNKATNREAELVREAELETAKAASSKSKEAENENGATSATDDEEPAAN